MMSEVHRISLYKDGLDCSGADTVVAPQPDPRTRCSRDREGPAGDRAEDRAPPVDRVSAGSGPRDRAQEPVTDCCARHGDLPGAAHRSPDQKVLTGLVARRTPR